MRNSLLTVYLSRPLSSPPRSGPHPRPRHRRQAQLRNTVSAVGRVTLARPAALRPSVARSSTVRLFLLPLEPYRDPVLITLPFAGWNRLLLSMFVISTHPSAHSARAHLHLPPSSGSSPVSGLHTTHSQPHGRKVRDFQRYDERAKTLCSSIAVSVFFWALFSRRYHVHV